MADRLFQVPVFRRRLILALLTEYADLFYANGTPSTQLVQLFAWGNGTGRRPKMINDENNVWETFIAAAALGLGISEEMFPYGWIAFSKKKGFIALNIPGYARIGGVALSVISTGVDAYGSFNYIYRPEEDFQVHPAKTAVNAGIGVLALTVSGGWVPATVYGACELLPGGLPGVINAGVQVRQEHNKIVGPTISGAFPQFSTY